MNNLIEIKQYLTGKVADAFKSLGYDTEGVSVAVSNRPEMADYQCNSVFILAKKTGKNPLALAEEVLPALQKNLNGIAEVSVAGAFVNLKLTQSGLSKIFEALYKAPTTEPKNGKTVVLDYGGANIAKELHMGHLRSPIIGEAIKNLYTKFGYTTIADAHLGDWGLQMGLVMAMLEEKGLVNFSSANAKLPNITLALLNECYPEASKRSKIDAEFKAKAEDYTLKLQHKQEPFYKVFKRIREVSVKAIARNYQNLNCHFDLWKGESDAEEDINRAVEIFEKKGLTKESGGAVIVEVAREGEHIPIPKKDPSDPNEKQLYKNPMPPLVLKKHNGGSLYATTDIATILQRVEENKNLAEIIYVTDKRQNTHFEQVFRACKMAGIAPEKLKLTHVGYGTMNGKDGKAFKTRAGTTIKLEDIIDLISSKAQEKLVANGNQNSSELALQIGVGAMKFGDLINDVSRDYIFDLDKFMSFEGKTGPYLQYTGVRIKSLLNKAGDFTPNFDIVCQEQKDILLAILALKQAYKDAFNALSPSLVCAGVYGVASSFSTFYNNNRILTETDKQKRDSYLTTCKLVLDNIAEALNILAIDLPERM